MTREKDKTNYDAGTSRPSPRRQRFNRAILLFLLSIVFYVLRLALNLSGASPVLDTFHSGLIVSAIAYLIAGFGELSVPRLSGSPLLPAVILAVVQLVLTLIGLASAQVARADDHVLLWEIGIALIVMAAFRLAMGALIAAMLCAAAVMDDLCVMILFADRLQPFAWVTLSVRFVLFAAFGALYGSAYVRIRKAQGVWMPSWKQATSAILCAGPWLLSWFWLTSFFVIIAPRFQEIFNDFDFELPRPTIMIINLSMEFTGRATPTEFTQLAAMVGVLMHWLLCAALGIFSVMLLTTRARSLRRWTGGLGWLILALAFLLLSLSVMVPLTQMIESLS